MNTTGQRIIDAIITGKLCHASCAHDPNHGCIVVWSSGAAEQLDALANTETDVLRQERDQLRALLDVAEVALKEMIEEKVEGPFFHEDEHGPESVLNRARHILARIVELKEPKL